MLQPAHLLVSSAPLWGSCQHLRPSLHPTARELAQQEEQVLLTQSSLHNTQEQLSERLTELTHQTQAGRRLEAELRVLNERLSVAEAELEQKR